MERVNFFLSCCCGAGMPWGSCVCSFHNAQVMLHVYLMQSLCQNVPEELLI